MKEEGGALNFKFSSFKGFLINEKNDFWMIFDQKSKIRQKSNQD